MANTHIIENDKNYGTYMDNILANDVRNQIQTQINKLSWIRCNQANCYYASTDVTIGNDEITEVIAFRSYETIVAFYWCGNIYEIGKYSRTTSSQIGRYFRNLVLNRNLGMVVIDKIYYAKL